MRASNLAKAAAVAIALAAPGAALALTGELTINTVTGKWTATTGTTATGLNSDTISWGDPAPPNTQQSSYVFDSATPPAIGPLQPNGAEFILGDFTHNNFPIFAPSITGATLEVEFDVDFDTGSGVVNQTLKSVFQFTHFETPNDDDPCAAGGPQPCGDLVTAVINAGLSDSITVGTTQYFLDITGFKVGEDDLSSFLTAENNSNTAQLRGRFTSELSAVPVPAALPLMLTALGGFAWLRRSRKA